MIDKLFNYDLNVSTNLAVSEVEQRFKEVTFLSDPFRVIFPDSVMDRQRFVGEVGDGRFHLRKPTRNEGGKATYIGVRNKGCISVESGETRIRVTFYHWWRSCYALGFGMFTVIVCGIAGLVQSRTELILLGLAACVFVVVFAYLMVRQVNDDVAFLLRLIDGKPDEQ